MTLSLADLFSADTRDELVAFFLDLAEDLGLPVTSWRSGDPTRTTLVLVAQKLSDLGGVIESVVRGGFLDTSIGVLLTWLALYVYGVLREPAAAAAGAVTLTNATSTPVPIGIGELVVAHETTNKTYRNTTAGTLGALGTLTLDVLAEEVGAESDAPPGAITVVVSSLIGVTVTNAASVLGRDEETDEALRARCRAKLGALSPNGPSAAYEYVATSTAVLVNRVKVDADSGTGDVAVTIASPSGVVSAPDVAIVDAAIQLSATPLCITATTASAVASVIPVTCDVWVYTSANLTDDEVETPVTDRLTAYFPTVPIGGDVVSGAGKLYVDKLRGQIEAALPSIFHAVIAAPSADVTLGDTDVAVLGTVTVNVHQVPRP